jgi:LysM domain
MDGQDTCAFCDQAAPSVCRRCARSFCDQHGAGAFCNACADPVASLPSPAFVRVAFWGLAICLVLGLVLVVRGPALSGAGAGGRVAGPAGAVTQAPSRSLLTPSPARPTASTPAAGSDYTVREGDTLALIAQSSGVTVAAIVQLNPTIDASNLQVGQVLHLPPRSP